MQRFEHGLKGQAASKIDNFIEFPPFFSMFPYLSERKPGEDIVLEADCNYSLFGVVVHTGKIESGHYVCYVRKRDMWFKCDDAWIISSTQAEVFRCHAYLLFYEKVKR